MTRGRPNSLLFGLLLLTSACDLCGPDIDDCIIPPPPEEPDAVPHYELVVEVTDIEGDKSGDHAFAATLISEDEWCNPAPAIGEDALFVSAAPPLLFSTLDARGYEGGPACHEFAERVIMTVGPSEVLAVDVDVGHPWLYSFHLPCPGLECESSGVEAVGEGAPGVGFTWKLVFDASAYL